MSRTSLLSTTDAFIWAKAFVSNKIKNKWSLDDIDEDLIVTWFANAMAAQEFHDEKLNKTTKDVNEKPQIRDRCVICGKMVIHTVCYHRKNGWKHWHCEMNEKGGK